MADTSFGFGGAGGVGTVALAPTQRNGAFDPKRDASNGLADLQVAGGAEWVGAAAPEWVAAKLAEVGIPAGAFHDGRAARFALARSSRMHSRARAARCGAASRRSREGNPAGRARRTSRRCSSTTRATAR